MGPLSLLLYTSELYSIMENKLIGYADDSMHFDGCFAIPRRLSYSLSPGSVTLAGLMSGVTLSE